MMLFGDLTTRQALVDAFGCDSPKEKGTKIIFASCWFDEPTSKHYFVLLEKDNGLFLINDYTTTGNLKWDPDPITWGLLKSLSRSGHAGSFGGLLCKKHDPNLCQHSGFAHARLQEVIEFSSDSDDDGDRLITDDLSSITDDQDKIHSVLYNLMTGKYKC